MADPDQLVIGGGGSMAVGTEELFDSAARLRSLESELAGHLRELASIDSPLNSGRLPAGDAPAGALSAERAMEDAAALLGRAHSRSGLLSAALDRSADAYGLAERATRTLAEAAAATIGYGVGFFLPVIAVQALPTILGAGAIVAPGLLLMPAADRERLFAELSGWVQKHSGVLSDPGFVDFVRLTVTSVDDFGAGLVHEPAAIDRLSNALGATGVASSAGVIVGLGGAVGYLKETPVATVGTSSTLGGTLPTGWEDRAGRIPQGDSQVRIDRYEVAGEPDRFEVYISGTRDFALGKDSQPWDMTSNLNGIAGGDPASVRAVEQAMQEAGVTSSSPVLLTGHSQGGLVAAIVAGSGDYRVDGLYTLGAPAAQTSVPSSVPWIAIEHANDIVPALSGSWTRSDPVVVSRELYDGPPVGSDRFFPAHQLDAYESTAAMLDRSVEPRVASVQRSFADFTAGATPVESTTYESVRVTG